MPIIDHIISISGFSVIWNLTILNIWAHAVASHNRKFSSDFVYERKFLSTELEKRYSVPKGRCAQKCR
jgi:hypothetical protein